MKSRVQCVQTQAIQIKYLDVIYTYTHVIGHLNVIGYFRGSTRVSKIAHMIQSLYTGLSTDNIIKCMEGTRECGKERKTFLT